MNLVRKGCLSLVKEGPFVCARKVRRYLVSKQARDLIGGVRDLNVLYRMWIDNKEKPYFDGTDFAGEIAGFSFKPLISIIMPVYNVDLCWLKKAYESVVNQYYNNWELCIVDDCSSDMKLREYIKKIAAEESRVKYEFLKKNSGIAVASNHGAKLSTGAYIALLDNDDELAPHALFEVVKLLNEKPEAKFIYSDEDKITEDGGRCDVYFKSAYSPDLLLSNMYICHLSVYERELFFSCGAFRQGYDGSQDHDLALRVVERTDEIHHIPKVLYHWRKIKGSTADNSLAKDTCEDASIQALEDACKRRGIKAVVEKTHRPFLFRVKREMTDNEMVSIIIPFKDKVKLLKQTVNSVYEKGGYKNIELLLVNNQSKEAETLAYLEEVKSKKEVRLIDYDEEFNYSDMNNMAVQAATGKYILLLNNDVKAIDDDFILALKEHAQRPEVGVVGAKLLYENMHVQHAGVILGVGGVADHSFRNIHHYDDGYFSQANIVRNVSVVTGACMMMRKEVFLEVGGFDEVNLKIALNDVDLCIKIFLAGYINVYTPYCLLYHYESATRGAFYKESEIIFMKKKYGDLLYSDPYYNENLSFKSPLMYFPDV